ncbi:DUF58 domain-containing protein [Thermococcus sp.]|uniref:DUF58 domain-containing protein n=1 Tax=Thermococcus sp. TaxID=35749 RepID=UPI0026300BC5|nr:DUF58 domain-containing protein [Thermococcus sp.]
MKRSTVLVSLTLLPFAFAVFTGVLGIAYVSLIPASLLAYTYLSDVPSGFHVERWVEGTTLSVGRETRVRVKLRVERGAGMVYVGDVPSPGLQVIGDNRRVFVKKPGKVLEVEYEYTLRPMKRGLHTLSPVEVIGRDFLGVLGVSYSIFGDEVRIEARPRIGNLRGRPLNRLRVRKPRVPVFTSTLGFTTNDFREIREYQPGDPLKKVNWKATARLGRALVNEYEPEGVGTVMLYIDTTTSMSAGDIFRGALESAISLSLSLIYTLLRTNLRVGVYFVGSGRFVTPRTGVQAFSTFMRTAVSVGPSSVENEDFSLAVERSRKLGAVDLAIFITNLTSYNVSEVREGVERLRSAWGCTVFVVDVNPYGHFGEVHSGLATLHKKSLSKRVGAPVLHWDPLKETPVKGVKRVLGGVFGAP